MKKLIALMVEAARERDREYSDFQARKLLIETPILLANGVTIQRWIPVTERLPEVNTDVIVAEVPFADVTEVVTAAVEFSAEADVFAVVDSG